MWAALHGWSFVMLPLGLLDSTLLIGAGVLVGATWSRLAFSVLVTRPVRKQPPAVLAVGLLTGPVGVLLLRRRLQQLLPVKVVRVRPH